MRFMICDNKWHPITDLWCCSVANTSISLLSVVFLCASLVVIVFVCSGVSGWLI